MSVDLLRREVPMAIIIFSTFVHILAYFIVSQPLADMAQYLQVWSTILIAASTSVAGAIGAYIHITHIRKRTPGQWFYSLFFLVVFIVALITGALLGSSSALYSWIVLQFQSSIYKSIQATVSLFIISAAYRGFRLRTTESSILVLVFLVCTLGTIGPTRAAIPQLETINIWFQNVLNLGITQAIRFISFFGILAQVVRSMLGRERGFFGEEAAQ